MPNPISAALLALLASSPALAQMSAEVDFQPGEFGTMLSGAVTGQDYMDYTLGAQAGQEMVADLTVTDTNGNGTAYFNILPPGSDNEAIFVGSMAADTTARVQLPETGTYTIRVYLMGNDADSGKTVGYTIDLSIQ
jgi:hypothetical protein